MLTKEIIPAMAKQRRILHSGPLITWEEMCDPVKGVIIGAMLYEGQATSRQDIESQVNASEIDPTSCHHYHAIGPTAGIISPLMPLWVVESKANDHRTFSNFNEGLGKVLRFSANNGEVLNRPAWTRDELAPAMKVTIAQHDELGLKPLMVRAPHMGGEVHDRNATAADLLIKRLPLALSACSLPQEHIQCVVAFITDNGHLFLNLSMTACKAMMDVVAGVLSSSMVTVTARNGMNFGTQSPGTGDHWFQVPANTVEGLLFPGFGVDDAATDPGDSAITGIADVGGLTMASSPAIAKFVGNTPVDVTNNSRRMQAVILDSNPTFILPTLNFTPTAAGADAHKVTNRGILPIINTGIAHKQTGVGQISAGITIAPTACFVATVHVLAETATKENHHG